MKILETVAWCVGCGKKSGTRKSELAREKNVKKIQLGSQEDPPVRNKTPSDSHSTHIRKTTHHREIKGTNNIYYKNHLQERGGRSF
jgi:hypothetical protein